MERPSFFIDFEASGIAPDSYPIEVAVVSRETSFSSLIKPALDALVVRCAGHAWSQSGSFA